MFIESLCIYLFLIVSPTLHDQATCGTITAAAVLAHVSGAPCHTSINEERADSGTRYEGRSSNHEGQKSGRI